jgi:hypothetical protein
MQVSDGESNKMYIYDHLSLSLSCLFYSLWLYVWSSYSQTCHYADDDRYVEAELKEIDYQIICKMNILTNTIIYVYAWMNVHDSLSICVPVYVPNGNLFFLPTFYR